MIKDKEAFLDALANFTLLSENAIAFIFASHPDINISSKEKFFDNIIEYYKDFKKNPGYQTIKISEADDAESDIVNWINRDLRIKSIRLKSVKSFPDSDIPFGINFTNATDSPQSMIILGGNGSGKSSVYDAMEFSYCQTIGEALLRAYKPDYGSDEKFKDFLRHFDNSTSSVYCKIETVSSDLDIQKDNIPSSIRNKINPDTHFISDYDIYSKGQLDYQKNSDRSFHNTIAESLGLTELLEFEKNLKAFTLYRRQTESRNVSALKKSNDNLQKIIDTNTVAIKERKSRVEVLKETQKENPDEKNIKEVQEKVNSLKNNNILFNFDTSQFASNINQFLKAFNVFISKEVKNGGLNEVQFLTLGLELLKDHDDCPFCNSSNIQKEEIRNNANSRLKEIKELSESSQELNKALNAIIDDFRNLKNQLDLTKGKVTAELSLIQEKVELNELNEAENKFLNYISEATSNDFIIETFRLEDNPNYLKDKYRFVYSILTNYKEFLDKKIGTYVSNIAAFPVKRLELIRKVELSLSEKISPKSVTEQIIELNKEITDLEAQIVNAKKNIDSDLKRINDLIETQVLFDAVKEDTINYLKIVHATLNKEVEKAFGPVKLVVEEILESYFKSDKRNVGISISKQPEDIDEETGEVLSEIITASIVHYNNEFPPQAVSKYLNTFHYRLFSTMVSVSIAIASRINTRVNLPLILDDIFYASDFENRATIEQFLKEIFKAFKVYTPDMPLQLIMFTHDQLIFESAIKALYEIDGISHNDVAFAKLFQYSESKQMDGYKNLIYRFPEYFPEKLTKRVATNQT